MKQFCINYQVARAEIIASRSKQSMLYFSVTPLIDITADRGNNN